jgi:hypothetical protein
LREPLLIQKLFHEGRARTGSMPAGFDLVRLSVLSAASRACGSPTLVSEADDDGADIAFRRYAPFGEGAGF